MEYKLYIFDLDGTFYDIGDLIAFNFKQERDFLMEKKKLSKEEAESLLINNHIYSEVREDAKSCTEFFQKIGIDLKEWNKVRSADFPTQLIQREHSINSEIIKRYKEKGIVTLVSNNTLENINKISDHLKIDLNLFDMIISKEDQIGSDKTGAYQKILNTFNIKPENALAIGDRLNIDVRPLLSLGGDGIVVNGPEGVRDYIQDAKTQKSESKERKNCNTYQFFQIQ